MEFLLQTIDQLPPRHRNVVLLVDVHGYDYSEAAAILELPLGTVKSRLSCSLRPARPVSGFAGRRRAQQDVANDGRIFPLGRA